MDASKIREKAKQELGEWFSKQIKESVVELYRHFRMCGLQAKEAIDLARMITQDNVNSFLESNFHSHIPINQS